MLNISSYFNNTNYPVQINLRRLEERGPYPTPRIDDRLVMLDKLKSLLPSGPKCAEIGSWRGDFAREIYSRLAPSTLHILDLWDDTDPKRYTKQNKKIVENKFQQEIRAGTVFTIAGPSLKTIPKLPVVDFAYLDTTHSYDLTSRELALLETHISIGGFLCGHDYTHSYGSKRYNGSGRIGYGVIEAVGEFLLYNTNFTLRFVTMEHLRNRHGSFCLRRNEPTTWKYE